MSVSSFPLICLVFTLIITTQIQPCDAYPGGAPEQACSTLNPQIGHGLTSNNATDLVPYDLTFSSDQYIPGTPLTVTLYGKNGTYFKGFLIQAFSSDDLYTSDSIGTFAVASNATYQATCSSATGNGVTHKSKSMKYNETFTWTAPANFNKDVIFSYTVVRGNDVSGPRDYFKDIHSDVVKAKIVTPTGMFIKDADCGKTKGCWGNCQSDNTCDWLITWVAKGERVLISLSSTFTSDNKYMAFGFSNMAGMSQASVVSCHLHNGTVDVIASFNPGYSNERLTNTTEGIHNVTDKSYTKGLLKCTFDREMMSTNVKIYNLTNPWYLITARGDVNSATGVIEMHTLSNMFNTQIKVGMSNHTFDQSFPDTRITTTTETSPTTTTNSPTPGMFIKDAACGKTKGCYSNCQSDNKCDWLMSWTKGNSESTIKISLMSTFTSDNKYVSLGFNAKKAMAPASVVSCRRFKGNVGVVVSYNPGYYNEALTNITEGISNFIGSYTNGLLKCSFDREILSTNPKIYNLSSPLYLITARGDVNSDGSLAQHTTSNMFLTNQKESVGNHSLDLSFPDTRLSTTPSSASTTTPLPRKHFPKDPGCGSSKACFSDCKDKRCSFLVSWEKVSDEYEFELKSEFNGGYNKYVAFGVATEHGMFPASVIGCLTTYGKPSASLSYNGGYSNEPVQASNSVLQVVNATLVDGLLSCTVRRAILSNHPKIFNLSINYVLIAARGPTSGGFLLQHTVDDRFLSSGPIALADKSIDISMNPSTYPLVKAHGCLMILAWILSASIGVVMARFFKPVWPETKLCGVNLWFAIHRASMVITFCLGCSAFVIIFIQVDGYSDLVGPNYQKAHPILGIIVTGLLVINPFLSMLRCGPDHPQRKLFNWVHFVIGNSAHILAAITIGIGMYLPKAMTDGPTGLIVLIIYASWQVLFFCIMSIMDFIVNNDCKNPCIVLFGNREEEYMPLAEDTVRTYGGMDADNKSKAKPVKKTNQGKSVKKPMLAVHVLVLTAVSAYLMYMIIVTDN